MSSFLELNNGLSIRYWTNTKNSSFEAGKPKIVLFHGNAFSLDNWIQIRTPDLLGREGYPVYVIDLPSGKGSKSSKVEKPKFSDYVPILENVFSELGVGIEQSSLVIVGPSMGGGFALAYAIAHPEQIAALVLISPSMRKIDDSELSALEKIPVLLIWGEKDNVFPLEAYARNLKNDLPLSKLLVLRGTGHAAYLDKPEEFHELLLDFLSEI